MDLQSLCVLPGKSCWVLHIDGLVLNADGSVLDALSLATKVNLSLMCPPPPFLPFLSPWVGLKRLPRDCQSWWQAGRHAPRQQTSLVGLHGIAYGDISVCKHKPRSTSNSQKGCMTSLRLARDADLAHLVSCCTPPEKAPA